MTRAPAVRSVRYVLATALVAGALAGAAEVPRRAAAAESRPAGVRSAGAGAVAAQPVGANPAGPACAGAAGLGDPFFPSAGNGGYDVAAYRIALDYSPGSRRLSATTAVTAVAGQRLCQFDLDFRGYAVRGVTVDGSAASWSRRGVQELVVRPARPLAAGHRFTVVVSYAGVPKPVIDPDGALDGWIPTTDGAFVAGEPQGAPSWFPCNDNPRDKATFDIVATVPAGRTAVGNGLLLGQRTTHGRTTFWWRMAQPMSTYLATVTSGQFAVSRGRTPGGVPYYNAVDPREARAQRVLAKLPAIVDYYSAVFGPYPFDAVGAIVDSAHRVGYALETQSRPVFDRAPSEATLAHELAHQWYGDSVTLRTWPDIWLNEGFAEWATWLWTEHAGGPTAAATFRRYYATPAGNTDFWNPPPGRVGEPANLFAGSVYDRGAMTLEALRLRIGAPTFARLLREWASRHRYGNATIEEFQALAERRSGRSLQHFFDVWLRTPGKPAAW